MTLTMFSLNAFYGLALAMNMFIIASGLNLIFGVLRVINFAHGMFYMFGAYIVFTVAKSWGAPFFLGVLAAAAALALIALAIERLLLRHLYGEEHLVQLLFTFAIVLLMGDAAKMIWGPGQDSVGYPPGLGGAGKLGLRRAAAVPAVPVRGGSADRRRHVVPGRPHALGPHRARRHPGPRDAGGARRQRADGLRRGVHHRLGAGRRGRRACRAARGAGA